MVTENLKKKKWVVTQNTLNNGVRVFRIGPLTLEDDITTWSPSCFSEKKNPVTEHNNPKESRAP